MERWPPLRDVAPTGQGPFRVPARAPITEIRTQRLRERQSLAQRGNARAVSPIEKQAPRAIRFIDGATVKGETLARCR
jgi:hypothetical protein